MAPEFHARLSISIQHTSSVILEPNKCLSPVGVSAHKSATTSACGGGVREDWEGGGLLAKMKNDNEISWCGRQCNYGRQTGQRVIPFASV